MTLRMAIWFFATTLTGAIALGVILGLIQLFSHN